jgi:hypothetical protein
LPVQSNNIPHSLYPSLYIYILYSIIIIVLITLLSIYLLGNLHLSPRVLEIRVLCDKLATVLLFASLFTMFLVKPILSRYFRKLLVITPSAAMTKRYVDTLLSFQIFLICRAKFSYFVIFLPRCWKGQGYSYIYLLSSLWKRRESI